MTKTDKLYKQIKDVKGDFNDLKTWSLLEVKMWVRANYDNYVGRVCDLVAEKIYYSLH